jgi:hypothetical protein
MYCVKPSFVLTTKSTAKLLDLPVKLMYSANENVKKWISYALPVSNVASSLDNRNALEPVTYKSMFG